MTLELHAEKTRLIEFGRFATQNREQRGEGKPETDNGDGSGHFTVPSATGQFMLGLQVKTGPSKNKNKQTTSKGAAAPTGVQLSGALTGWPQCSRFRKITASTRMALQFH